jgi:hypothetical protein
VPESDNKFRTTVSHGMAVDISDFRGLGNDLTGEQNENMLT